MWETAPSEVTSKLNVILEGEIVQYLNLKEGSYL